MLACGDNLIFCQVGDDPAPQVLRGAASHIPVRAPVLLPLEPGAQVEDVTGAFPRVALQVDHLEAPEVVKEPIGNGGEPVGTEVDDFSRRTESNGQVFYSQVFPGAVSNVGGALAGHRAEGCHEWEEAKEGQDNSTVHFHLQTLP